MDLPKRSTRAIAPAKRNPGWAVCGLQPLAKESHQVDDRAAQFGFQPRNRPTRISPSSAAVLAKVNEFCTSLATFSPRVLVQVRKRMIAMATSCSVETQRHKLCLTKSVELNICRLPRDW